MNDSLPGGDAGQTKRPTAPGNHGGDQAARSAGTSRRTRWWMLVLGLAVLAGCVFATARLIPVMIDQQHPVHVTGSISSGGCYTQSSEDGDSTQCDVTVKYRTLAGVAGTAKFHHVPAESITEHLGSGAAARHPNAQWTFSAVGITGVNSATMPVYFDPRTSTHPINPNDINSEWVYGLLLAGIWLIGALFGVVPLIRHWRLRSDSGSVAAQPTPEDPVGDTDLLPASASMDRRPPN